MTLRPSSYSTAMASASLITDPSHHQPPTGQVERPWLQVTSIAQILIYVLLALVFLVVNFHPLWHTDVWAHLRYGEWIWQHGELPKNELFVSTAGTPEAYQPHAWLGQVALYLVFRAGELLTGSSQIDLRWAGGVEMLRLLLALLVAGRFLILALAYHRLSQSWWLAFIFLVTTVVFSLANLLILRPQTFGELCFAILLLTLARPVPSTFALWGMPVLFALWANLHGSFLVGMICLLGFAGGRMLFLFATHGFQPRAYWSDPRFRLLIRMFYVSVAIIALLNPVGLFLGWEVYRFGQHPNIADMDEWKRIDFHTPWGWSYFASLLVILATHLTGLFVPPPDDRPDRKFGPIPLGQLILLMCFGLQTYLHQRMMPWWVMLVPWICVGPWGNVLRTLRRSEAEKRPIFALAALPACLLVMVWLAVPLLFSGPALWLESGRPRALEAAVHAGTPLALACQLRGEAVGELESWLRQCGSFPGGVFATETQGDFLVWALPKELAPPIYTHVHLFTPAYWQKIMSVKRGEPQGRAWLDANKMNLLCFESELHPNLRRLIYAEPSVWQVVRDDFGSASVADPRARLLIAVRKLPIR